jgi:hypothetical protein
MSAPRGKLCIRVGGGDQNFTKPVLEEKGDARHRRSMVLAHPTTLSENERRFVSTSMRVMPSSLATSCAIREAWDRSSFSSRAMSKPCTIDDVGDLLAVLQQRVVGINPAAEEATNARGALDRATAHLGIHRDGPQPR